MSKTELTIRDQDPIVKDIANRITSLNTTEERVYAYINAEDIIHATFKQSVTALRGTVLRREKMYIDSKHGNLTQEAVQNAKDEWRQFLSDIGELRANGQPKRQILRLLKFAEYIALTEAKGITVKAPTDEQLRLLGTKDLYKSAKQYDTLVMKYNEGEPFKTAKELQLVMEVEEDERTAEAETAETETAEADQEDKDLGEQQEQERKHQATLKHISYRSVYEQKHQAPQGEIKTRELHAKMVASLPTVTADTLKSFYRKTAKALHPDKGGSADDMAILTAIKSALDIQVQNDQIKEAKRLHEVSYKEWKELHGFKKDYDNITEEDYIKFIQL
jgi:hypothetical protein